jgi:hypothetical protein
MTIATEPRARIRLAVVAAAAAGLLVGAATSGASPAAAAPKVSVSQVDGLDPAGATLTVSGTGFDASKGIYVALCVRPAPGQAPSPCLGGADTTGGGGSHWISSNPPPYGEGLATPYGPSGSFTVSLRVQGADAFTDCLADGVQCAVVTRADHTRQGDRSCDVVVPVAFTGQQVSTAGTSASGSGCSYDAATDPLAAPAGPGPESPAGGSDAAVSSPDEPARSGENAAAGSDALAGSDAPETSQEPGEEAREPSPPWTADHLVELPEERAPPSSDDWARMAAEDQPDAAPSIGPVDTVEVIAADTLSSAESGGAWRTAAIVGFGVAGAAAVGVTLVRRRRRRLT